MKQFVDRLRRSTFARQVSILAGGTLCAQLITTLAQPVLTRLYSPEQVGVLTVYTSFMAIISNGAFRYEYALPLPKEDDDAANLLALTIVIVFGAGLLVTLAMLAGGPPLLALLQHLDAGKPASQANWQSLAPYLPWVPVSFLGINLYLIMNYWAIRRRYFAEISRTRYFQAIAQAAAQIGGGLARFGVLGLIIGYIVGQAGGINTLIAQTWKQDRRLWPSVSFAGMRQAAARFRRFPLFSFWAGLLNGAVLQLPMLLFFAMFQGEATGWFSLTMRVILIPTALIGTAVSQVYLSDAARLKHESPHKVLALFHQTVKHLLLVGSAIALVFLVASPWLFSVIFGAQWREVGEYARLLSLTFLGSFVVSSISQTLNMLERQDLQLLCDAGRLLCVLAVFWVAHYTHLSAYTTVMLYSLCMFVTYGGMYLLNLYALKRACTRHEAALTVNAVEVPV